MEWLLNAGESTLERRASRTFIDDALKSVSVWLNKNTKYLLKSHLAKFMNGN